MESETGKLTYAQRLCKKDNRRFLKYIESTTTHGVSHIFIGKSKIRRLLWAIVVVALFGGCLYNIIDRILFLAEGPTSTTISLTRMETITFPAVTICNLNQLRSSYLHEMGLEDLVTYLSLTTPQTEADIAQCRVIVDGYTSILDEDFGYIDLLFEGRNFRDTFIRECSFLGEDCNENDFVLTLTQLGYCYTFNSGINRSEILTIKGTGSRHSLQLLLNIAQGEYSYSVNRDAGVKVVVHPQGEPPRAEDFGIAVPPGRNAFIGLKEKKVVDRSSNRGQRCRESSETQSFEFLGGRYSYSTSACVSDCFLRNIAEECGCIGASSSVDPNSRFSGFPECGLSDLCCVLGAYYRVEESCPCPVACSYTVYETGVSYSEYPAMYQIEMILRLLGFNASELGDTGGTFLQQQLVSVNVHFQDLNVEEQITEDAYGVIALLSDIGGQLGLFLGASIISVIEFLTWLLDEVKDRCFGLSDKKIKHETQQWMDKVVNAHNPTTVEMDEIAKSD